MDPGRVSPTGRPEIADMPANNLTPVFRQT